MCWTPCRARELRAGYAEVAKYGLIDDPAFFAWLEEQRPPVLSSPATGAAHAADRPQLPGQGRDRRADERETAAPRALLNLGHTFGHALEAETGYSAPPCCMARRSPSAWRWPSTSRPSSACAPQTRHGRVRAPSRARRPADTPARDRRRQPPDAERLMRPHAPRTRRPKAASSTFILARGIGEAFVEPRRRRRGSRPSLDAASRTKNGDGRPEIHLDISLELAALPCAALPDGGELSLGRRDGDHRACRAPRMHRLAQQGNRRAALVNSLLERKDEVVSATLIGNSVLNIFAASLTTAVLTNLFGSAGVAYATIFVTVLVVLFVEVLPKTWALLHADRVALVLAPTLNGVLKVIGPVARAATRAARISLNLFGVRAQSHDDAQAQDDMLRGAIELHGEGLADEAAPAEKAMLRSVLNLADLTVGDVMVHRGNVALIDAAPAGRRDRDPGAGGALHPHPALPRRARQHRGHHSRQGPVPRVPRPSARRDHDRYRQGDDAALVHPRGDHAVRTSSRPSVPATSISPSWSTNMAACAASSPSRTSSRRSSATSRTSTIPT